MRTLTMGHNKKGMAYFQIKVLLDSELLQEILDTVDGNVLFWTAENHGYEPAAAGVWIVIKEYLASILVLKYSEYVTQTLPEKRLFLAITRLGTMFSCPITMLIVLCGLNKFGYNLEYDIIVEDGTPTAGSKRILKLLVDIRHIMMDRST